METFGIRPTLWLRVPVKRKILRVLMTLVPLAFAAPLHAAAPGKGAFTGAWTVQWCDKARPTADCGHFTVYLLQRGERVCGSHHGASLGLSRVDEGKDRSVLGIAVGSTAVLTVQSGRTEAVLLMTAKRQRDVLHWERREAVTAGNGDSDEIANKAVLRRVKPASISKVEMDKVRAACEAHWGAVL